MTKPERGSVPAVASIISMLCHSFGLRPSSFVIFAAMIFFLVLVVLVFLAQIVEIFIPPLDWMFNAHVYIVPVIVFYGAMALPFPLMLSLAFVAGFLWDAMTVQLLDAHVEISFGWSILLYAVLAAIMHGLRPLFNRGRWEVHCVLSGVCTALILLAQYLMISFRRGSLILNHEVVVADRRPGSPRHAHGPAYFLVAPLDCPPNEQPLSSTRGGLR